MHKLQIIANKAKGLKIEPLMAELFNNKSFTDLIIQLNTEDQLFNKGINSSGVNLERIGGYYSGKTVRIKKEKGQPVDRVTLKDTGAFYRSFEVFLDGQNNIGITAASVKDGTDILERWGENVLGLTSENKAKVSEVARPMLIELLRKNILE